MKDPQMLYYQYEGINFTVLAVAGRSPEQWVAAASQQYFPDLTKTEREQKLAEVYAACAQMKKDNEPKYEAAADEPVVASAPLPATGRKARVKPKEATDTDGDAAAII